MKAKNKKRFGLLQAGGILLKSHVFAHGIPYPGFFAGIRPLKKPSGRIATLYFPAKTSRCDKAADDAK